MSEYLIVSYSPLSKNSTGSFQETSFII